MITLFVARQMRSENLTDAPMPRNYTTGHILDRGYYP